MPEAHAIPVISDQAWSYNLFDGQTRDVGYDRAARKRLCGGARSEIDGP
jgi:hypothetical protein